MPAVFVDTSAIYALLDRSDANHARARSVLPTLRHRRPVTHNYVLVEAVALVQARLGVEAVRRLLDDLVPVVELRFVDASSMRRPWRRCSRREPATSPSSIGSALR
jgi:predicted nucleic acid-binding protein